jgi:hypothetical protein
MSQRERFIKTARELGCEGDQEAFERPVKKLADSPPPVLRKRKRKAPSGKDT